MFKNSKSRFFFTILLMLVFVVSGIYFSPNLHTATIMAQDEKSGLAQPNLSAVWQNGTNQGITINDVTMKFLGAHWEGNYLQVDICYTLPDDRDWLLTDRPADATLVVADLSMDLVEEGTLDWKFAEDGTQAERCEYLLFSIKTSQAAKEATLILKKIIISAPERSDCVAIQKELDRTDESIVLECPSPDQMGVGGFTIRQKPDDLTMTEAVEIARDIEGDARKGPWVFTFSLPQP